MMQTLRCAAILTLCLAALACAPRETPAPAPSPGAAAVPHRVVDGATGAVVGFDALVDRVADVDVVYFGEQHDDPGTHRLQLALLESLAGRGEDVVLTLEMFERDVQPRLDDYLAGRIDEATFRDDARPWPNYASDYRPLVELARERGWPVVAANVPRRFAAGVAEVGLDTLNRLPPEARSLVARDVDCPRDDYYDRFLAAMGMHPGADEAAEARVARYYEAQCVKDETMAESIVAVLEARPDAVVVHVTGAFHSDFGHGIPARVERRVPGTRTVVVSAIPVAEPSRAAAEDHRGRADYLIFTRDPAAGRGAEAETEAETGAETRHGALPGAGAEAEPVAIVLPVTRPDGTPLVAPGPDGDGAYPVVRAAPASPRVAAIREVLEAPHPATALRLDRYARNLALHVGPGTKASPWMDGLAEPVYLLLTEEDGGFARFGLWLEDAGGGRRFVPAGYIVMVADAGDVAGGGFEEVFLHELAHITLRNLFGRMPAGWSPKMHMSMAITDYPTAFDEGFAIHTQPNTRARTSNPSLLRTDRGEGVEDAVALWHSRVDGRLRSDGVRSNLFVHRKALPVRALDPEPDAYRLFIESQTSSAFARETLRTGQQMLASEGAVATIFHRLAHDERLRGRYRDARFYQPFLDVPDPKLEPAARFSPEENVYLKLFAAIHALGRTSPGPDVPLPAALVEAYGELFPDERAAAYQTFILTTFGATVSPRAVAEFEAVAGAGVVGDMAAFVSALPKHRTWIAGLVRDAVDGRLALDAAIGPELWILHEAFPIAPALWLQERTLPLALNLNTATIAEWMTLPGVDLALARRIVSARDGRGFFQDIEDLGAVEGVTPELMERLRRMRDAMARARPADRL